MTNNCATFVDEIETMCPDRSKVRETHIKENVTEFLVQVNLLDEHNAQRPLKEVFLLAASNHPQQIDSAVW